MTTNNYPGIGYTTLGYDRNFFEKVSVTATTFGGTSVSGQQPDVIINLRNNTRAVQLLNLGGSPGGIVEFSFNGQVVHGELNPSNQTAGLTFDDRPISCIWFRIQTGSSGPITVSVAAWSRD